MKKSPIIKEFYRKFNSRFPDFFIAIMDRDNPLYGSTVSTNDIKNFVAEFLMATLPEGGKTKKK